MISANISELKDFLAEILTVHDHKAQYFKTPAAGRKPEKLKALKQREKTIINRARNYYQQLIKEQGE